MTTLYYDKHYMTSMYTILHFIIIKKLNIVVQNVGLLL